MKKNVVFTILGLFIVLLLKAQTITIIAGISSTTGYSGNGGAATAAELNSPEGLAIDNSGNIYIADDGNNVIRKVNTLGVISTIAGKGVSGYTGDGSLATNATLNQPDGVAIDSTGNIYIADGGNNVIRKINTNGVISTIAGNGYGAGTGNGGYSGNGSAATAAELNSPAGVTIDKSGNIYIGDIYNNVIRIVNTKGVISGFAGNTNAGYSGNGGLATSAELRAPSGVVLDNYGSVYIADGANNVIRKVNTNGVISTIAGNGYGAGAVGGFSGDGGQATSAELSGPYGVTFDSFGNMYIADALNFRVRRVNTNGIISTIAGSGGSISDTAGIGGPATAKSINEPASVATDALGNVYIACGGSCIYKVIIPKPMVNFEIGDSNICAGNAIQFSDESSSIPNNWKWTFPGGTPSSSSLQNPKVVYNNSGVYTAKLVASNLAGSDSITRTFNIIVSPTSGFDLTGNLYVCIDTPANKSASIQACIFNNRCKMINGVMKLLLDSSFHITNTISDSVAHVSGDTLIWNYDSLSYSGRTHCVSLTGNISNMPNGDSVFVSMFITPITNDSVPTNNNITEWVKSFPYNCIGLPFDPNEKSVYPEGNILPTQQLTYTIHFQNTGTAIAHNVVLVDTLSQYIDPTSLKVISSSSEIQTSITSGNIVKFTFNNIDLPDTATSKTTSIGVVSYLVNPFNSDVVGTQIKNNAGIYFDANPVVITNTTVNTITGSPLSVQNAITNLNIACFPNPFISNTNVIFNNGGKHFLEIDDMTGRKLMWIECNGRQYELVRNNLPGGIYLIKAFDEEQHYVAYSKIIVQ